MALSTIDQRKALALAEYLKTARFPENIDELATKTTQQVSARIDCLTCANCCKTSPPIIIPSDIKRISKHLGISKKQFQRKYILEDVNGEMSFINVPCSFLREDNYCSIYEQRPEACRRYPHTDNKGFARLKRLHAKNVSRCPIAFEVVKKIKDSIDKI